MERVPYIKPYLPLRMQVELLRARGMNVADMERAAHCLQRIGYYRLSGYWFPFRHQEIRTNLQGKEERHVSEMFRFGTSFDDVMRLYVFDKKLRLLFIDAIERIEVGLRVDIALILGARGAFAHRSPENFNAYFGRADSETSIIPHEEFLRKIDEAFDRSKEDFATSFRLKYSTAMPIWMCIELWDFGTLANVISGMRSDDLKQLADRYGLPRNKLLISWAQSINFVRYVCAHHGRLWNRPPVQQPGPTRLGEIEILDHLAADQYAQRRLYAVAASLQYLLRTIHPGTSWSLRLMAHFDSFPEIQGLSIRQMGFADNWMNLYLWRSRRVTA
jgi:abortive infection bacteriophage resistance protein